MGFVSSGKGVTEQMRTYVPKGREAEDLTVGKDWRVVDADGKDKANYTPNLDCGDHVIVINAERVRLTGNKLDQKIYRHHSGYPGGLKEISVRALMQRRPEEVVREAVVGMLPKNKLRARRAKKLRVYTGKEALARHAGQKPQPVAL